MPIDMRKKEMRSYTKFHFTYFSIYSILSKEKMNQHSSIYEEEIWKRTPMRPSHSDI